MSRPDKLSTKILDLLKANHLLSVPQLQAALTTANQPHNKTSLYRSLEKLEAAQTVCAHHFQGTTTYYELRDHHHDHFVCEKCHTVEQLECQTHVTGPVTVNGSARTITHHHSTFYGLCERCKINT
jgi:Fe2+ or Zn2+ uptake regulation protein